MVIAGHLCLQIFDSRFRDALPRDEIWAEKRWVTDGFASPVLYEYENERELLNKKQIIKWVSFKL